MSTSDSNMSTWTSSLSNKKYVIYNASLKNKGSLVISLRKDSFQWTVMDRKQNAHKSSSQKDMYLNSKTKDFPSNLNSLCIPINKESSLHHYDTDCDAESFHTDNTNLSEMDSWNGSEKSSLKETNYTSESSFDSQCDTDECSTSENDDSSNKKSSKRSRTYHDIPLISDPFLQKLYRSLQIGIGRPYLTWNKEGTSLSFNKDYMEESLAGFTHGKYPYVKSKLLRLGFQLTLDPEDSAVDIYHHDNFRQMESEQIQWKKLKQDFDMTWKETKNPWWKEWESDQSEFDLQVLNYQNSLQGDEEEEELDFSIFLSENLHFDLELKKESLDIFDILDYTNVDEFMQAFELDLFF